MKYIEVRIKIKARDQEMIEELAESIKDTFYDYDEELNPVEDVTYEIKETPEEN